MVLGGWKSGERERERGVIGSSTMQGMCRTCCTIHACFTVSLFVTCNPNSNPSYTFSPCLVSMPCAFPCAHCSSTSLSLSNEPLISWPIPHSHAPFEEATVHTTLKQLGHRTPFSPLIDCLALLRSLMSAPTLCG